MMTEQETREMIQSSGYEILGTFRLPGPDWWTHYYTPLSRKLDVRSKDHAGNEDEMQLVLRLRMELEIHRKYSREYGYTFFVMRKG